MIVGVAGRESARSIKSKALTKVVRNADAALAREQNQRDNKKGDDSARKEN